MNPIRLIHSADWHLSEKPKLQKKAQHNLDQMLKFTQDNQVDGLLIAGDIWDRIQPFGNQSAIKMAFEYLGEFSKYVKFIFIIKGNSSHDANQSVELLHNYKSNIFATESHAAIGISLKNSLTFDDLLIQEGHGNYDLIIHGISYPVKAQLISSNSIDFQNLDFIGHFEKLLEYHGMISAQHVEVPIVTAFHGNVSGSKLSSGQSLIGQDIIIPPFVLEKMQSDYYALGHIHLPQNINPKMRYSGSLYNKDFGELEQKGFDLLKIQGKEVNVENISFKAWRPMIVVSAEFIGNEFIYDKAIPQNAEVKFRYTVKENERALITQNVIKALKEELGQDTQFEAITQPSERQSRTSKIMEVPTLACEVEEYLKVTGEIMTDSIKEKIQSIECDNKEEGFEACV